MQKLLNTADTVRRRLTRAGIDQFACTAAESELNELNTENGEFSLLRTVFDQDLSVTVIMNGKKGSVHGSDLSAEGVAKLCDDAVSSPQNAPEDAANAIAPGEGRRRFVSGCPDADNPALYDRLRELKEAAAARYPLVHIMTVNASHSKERRVYLNSNGSVFESENGWYDISLEFTGKNGDRVTGFFYSGCKLDSLDRPLIECGDIAMNLKAAQESLNTVSLPETFTGRVIMTPGCAGQFIYMMISSYLDKSVILDGTSPWLDRIGEKVASESLSLSLEPLNEKTVCGERYTYDGFITENVPLIENGVLKNQMIDLYTAGKTGRKAIKCTDWSLYVRPGKTPYDEIVRSVDKGLLVGGFSGGEPGTSGDFSGVAKNAFYIENGKIAGAVNEVMINGRLADIFGSVTGVSSETLCDGTGEIPWIAFDGIVISGK